MALSTFMGLETTLRGILAQQSALDTTGHNITNADTTGYSRQTAVLGATPAMNTTSGLLGTGVEVTGYQRIRDQLLDVQYRAQNMQQGAADVTADGLNQVQSALNEPSDTGLSALIQNYYSAWSDVANDPADTATRQSLAQSAETLADGFNSLSTQISTITSQTATQVTSVLGQVNSYGGQIAQLNTAISKSVSVGDQPNDLLDQRDVLLDKLSALGNTSVTSDPDGSVDVSVGGAALVTGTTSATLAESDMTSLSSGQLAGLIQLRDTTLPGYSSQLDSIASALISATNSQSAAGFDQNGNVGSTFFTGTDAATIAVNPSLVSTPALIAASGDGTAGNAQNAQAMVALQDSALVGGTTISGAYSQLVTQIGADAQQAIANDQNATSLTQAVDAKRQSVSGVSLDEEMTNLLRFQRGYQASARALSAMDEMLDTLINRTGKVGL